MLLNQKRGDLAAQRRPAGAGGGAAHSTGLELGWLYASFQHKHSMILTYSNFI